MSPKPLTATEATEIQTALAQARLGRATLTQLAHAHDLATAGCLNGCLGELREHIRNLTPGSQTPESTSRSEIMRDITLGVLAGFITEHLLERREKRGHHA
jgi:hypothetical protein